MPLYEYLCGRCGRFEVIQKFSDPPLKRCPRCGKGVKKQLSAPAIQFKGTGWYVTDYARKAAGDAAGSPGGDGKSAPDGKPGAEAKPEAQAKPGAEGKADSARKPEAGKKPSGSKGRSSA